MEVTVSIIIPVYNTGAYLSRCIDSILNQTYADFEIIIVNDGSTDDTHEIANKYMRSDERIFIIEQENMGVVKARERGLLIAKGKYVIFIDSDDWIEPEMIEFMISNIGDSQMITTAAFFEKENGQEKVTCDDYDEHTYSGEEFQKLYNGLIYDKDKRRINKFTHWLWNKMFVTDIVRTIYPYIDPSIKNFEDKLIVILYVLNCNSIKITHKSFYHHTYRWGSAARSINYTFLASIGRVYEILDNKLNGHKYESELRNELQKWFSQVTYAYLDKRANLSNDNRPIKNVADIRGLDEKRVVLYAGGRVGREYYRQLTAQGINIVLWVDSNWDSLDTIDYRGRIMSPEGLNEIDYDVIYIAVEGEKTAESIIGQLSDKGVSLSNIIWKKPYKLM